MEAQKVEQVDIRVENHGYIWLLRPLSPFGADWLQENVYESTETLRLIHNSVASYGGTAVACEPRYAAPVIRAMIDEGLEVR